MNTVGTQLDIPIYEFTPYFAVYLMVYVKNSQQPQPECRFYKYKCNSPFYKITAARAPTSHITFEENVTRCWIRQPNIFGLDAYIYTKAYLIGFIEMNFVKYPVFVFTQRNIEFTKKLNIIPLEGGLINQQSIDDKINAFGVFPNWPTPYDILLASITAQQALPTIASL